MTIADADTWADVSGHEAAAAIGGAAKLPLGLKTMATDRLTGLAEEGRDQVAKALGGVAQGAREFASRLGDEGGPVTDYAHRAADMLGEWSHDIRDKDVRQLVDEAKHLVQRSPGVAIGAAVVAGFLLSRLLKAA